MSKSRLIRRSRLNHVWSPESRLKKSRQKTKKKSFPNLENPRLSKQCKTFTEPLMMILFISQYKSYEIGCFREKIHDFCMFWTFFQSLLAHRTTFILIETDIFSNLKLFPAKSLYIKVISFQRNVNT